MSLEIDRAIILGGEISPEEDELIQIQVAGLTEAAERGDVIGHVIPIHYNQTLMSLSASLGIGPNAAGASGVEFNGELKGADVALALSLNPASRTPDQVGGKWVLDAHIYGRGDTHLRFDERISPDTVWVVLADSSDPDNPAETLKRSTIPVKDMLDLPDMLRKRLRQCEIARISGDHSQAAPAPSSNAVIKVASTLVQLVTGGGRPA